MWRTTKTHVGTDAPSVRRSEAPLHCGGPPKITEGRTPSSVRRSKAPHALWRTTKNHVGTDALVRPAEQSSAHVEDHQKSRRDGRPRPSSGAKLRPTVEDHQKSRRGRTPSSVRRSKAPLPSQTLPPITLA